MSIWKHTNGNFYVQFRDVNGVLRNKSTRSTRYEDAVVLEDQLKEQRKVYRSRGFESLLESVPFTPYTIGEHRDEEMRSKIITRLRARAKMNGLECTVTGEDVRLPIVCPVFGLELEYGGRGKSDNTATIDRIDPSKGYVPGNIETISWKANRLKSNCGDWTEFGQLALYLKDRK